jgi:hypothetical protein
MEPAGWEAGGLQPCALKGSLKRCDPEASHLGPYRGATFRGPTPHRVALRAQGAAQRGNSVHGADLDRELLAGRINPGPVNLKNQRADASAPKSDRGDT